MEDGAEELSGNGGEVTHRRAACVRNTEAKGKARPRPEKPTSKLVQPMAHWPHEAQDGWAHGLTHVRQLSENVMKISPGPAFS